MRINVHQLIMVLIGQLLQDIACDKEGCLSRGYVHILQSTSGGPALFLVLDSGLAASMEELVKASAGVDGPDQTEVRIPG